jgi:hypothetical protein
MPFLRSVFACAAIGGTQFRQWAIGHLKEYLVKGFTIDEERLKPFTGEIPPDHPRGSRRNWVGLIPEVLRKKWLK